MFSLQGTRPDSNNASLSKDIRSFLNKFKVHLTFIPHCYARYSIIATNSIEKYAFSFGMSLTTLISSVQKIIH